MTTKQKNIRDYIIGLGIICVLVVALIVTWDSSKIKDGETSEEETEENPNVVIVEGEPITDMDITDMEKITYTLRGKETVVFEKTSDTWVLNGDEDFPLSIDSFEQ